MQEKLAKIAERIDKRISEKTGLDSKEEIEVYSFICTHADFNNGVIMSGDVVHDIYTDLLSKASVPMKVLEKVYGESLANYEEVPPGMETRNFKSPLLKKAWQIYSQHMLDLAQRSLIGISKEYAFGTRYPVLKGYNYFNDKEFYKKVGTKRSQGRELIV
jgi:hypothetical protein